MMVKSKQEICDIDSVPGIVRLSDKAFAGFGKLIFEKAGISMSSAKKTLVASRLGKRLRALKIESYDGYLKYLLQGDGASNGEMQCFIDLLTTNETYFFRESQHFDYLCRTILPNFPKDKRLRIWSAASSSGEEAYTLAMLLAEELGVGGNWEILGTDISSKVVKAAQAAVYNEHRIRLVPKHIKHKYLMRGTGSNEGLYAVVPELLRHVTFDRYNLIDSPARREMFDVIFCRNVLIYFDGVTKQRVVERLMGQLSHGGYLFTGHSESLHSMSSRLQSVMPSVYYFRGYS